MATQLKRRRGSTAAHATFTGAQGELTVNTDTNRVHVHDGATANGHPLALLADAPIKVVDSSSAANSIEVNSNTGPTSPIDGMILSITVALANTGGCTIAYNGAAPAPLVTVNGAPLAAAALAAGQQILVQYFSGSGEFVWLNAGGGGVGATAAPSYGGFGANGTLVITPVLSATGSVSFGPFTTAYFDTTNTFTPAANHVYCVDFSFSSFSTSSIGSFSGGSPLIKYGSNGYSISYGGGNLGLNLVAGTSETNINYIPAPVYSGPQRMQLLFYANSAGNRLSVQIFGSNTPLTAYDTTATLLGNAIEVGYCGNAGDVLTCHVYDMGLI